jgi:hypothetical protein
MKPGTKAQRAKGTEDKDFSAFCLCSFVSAPRGKVFAEWRDLFSFWTRGTIKEGGDP